VYEIKLGAISKKIKIKLYRQIQNPRTQKRRIRIIEKRFNLRSKFENVKLKLNLINEFVIIINKKRKMTISKL
tara:strand:- start:1756 stop:1974 length:219 start_codon:yes stop_codon:yes gene_type:complete